LIRRGIRRDIASGIDEHAQIVQHQDVALVPTMGILEFRRTMMVKPNQAVRRFLLFYTIKADRVARVGI